MNHPLSPRETLLLSFAQLTPSSHLPRRTQAITLLGTTLLFSPPRSFIVLQLSYILLYSPSLYDPFRQETLPLGLSMPLLFFILLPDQRLTSTLHICHC